MDEAEEKQNNPDSGNNPQTGQSGQGAVDPYDKPGAVSRRRFLTATFAGATVIGLGALAAPLARYAYPVFKPEVFEKVQVATLSALAPLGPGVNFEYQDIPAQLIMLEDGTPAAYSLICPHLGCIIKWVPKDSLFECPCHAAKFTPDGAVFSGPPPRPMTKLTTAVDGDAVYVEGVEPEEG